MNPALVFCIFWLYSLGVYLTKRRLYPWALVGGPLPREPWRPGQEFSICISPDYWWARRFKYRLQAAATAAARADLLKAYVVTNNRMNLCLSMATALICLLAKAQWPGSLFFHVAAAVAVVRFFSRSYEITYAFGLDVLQTATAERTATGLRKEERVRLALLSYFEIYLYAAAAYTALPAVRNAGEALTLSINVGTLTNVGYVYAMGPAGSPSFVLNIVFVQVITTLSLVVLSLAAYLARKD
ncbi:MAG: hypothetical protein V4505_04775 [Pseudomonadota bacterium]